MTAKLTIDDITPALIERFRSNLYQLRSTSDTDIRLALEDIIESETCEECDGDGEFTEECGTCDGSGEFECEECSGDGCDDCENGVNACGDCSSTGTITVQCSECSGNGAIPRD